MFLKKKWIKYLPKNMSYETSRFIASSVTKIMRGKCEFYF